MKALFLGGDLRQAYACEYLNKCGIQTEYIRSCIIDESTVSKIEKTHILVLPVPTLLNGVNFNITDDSQINIYDIFAFLNNKTIVFGGKLSIPIKDYLITKEIKYIDLFDIESFQIQNALLSAEGAIYYAKQRLERSIHGAEIAILGFGRIGKILAYLLSSQGAKITVCARKDSDFTWSKLIGFNGFKIKTIGNKSNIDLINNKYDLIINTIPFWIMDESFAKSINGDTIIIDLASYPYGIDESIVSEYDLKYFRELGIPGRYAPQSAGEIIAKTILNNLPIVEE